MSVCARVSLWLAAAQLFLTAPGFASEKLLREWFAGFAEVPGTAIRLHRLETTQEVYELIVGANPSRWRGPCNSVEMLSWQDALTFCTKATQVLRVAKLIGENEALRLPTEAEWEIACRVGSQTAYSFGDDPAQLGEYAWFHGNAAGNDPPAGAKKPNVWGFFDMHGYLWEWCLASDGKTPVARGGAWTSPAEECRSDSRKLFPAATKSPDLGFRCALGKR